MIRRAALTAITAIVGVGMWGGGADAMETKDAKAKSITVDCSSASLQNAVNKAGGAATIFVTGECLEDVVIAVDDITLSGNPAAAACDPGFPGGTGTIVGTVSVIGVRATIESLTITGEGVGVLITDRGAANLNCNLIDANDESGVIVINASHATLRGNTVTNNGLRDVANPTRFFDCGLFAGNASSVNSFGNTYAGNAYCAIEADRQSAFRNGSFVPRDGVTPVDPSERDLIVQIGCDLATGNGCDSTDFTTVAVEIFNNGLVDLRNAQVGGKIELFGNSTIKLDDEITVRGNIEASHNAVVNFRQRPGRNFSFTGSLSCSVGAVDMFSTVECGQTCSGDGSSCN